VFQKTDFGTKRVFDGFNPGGAGYDMAERILHLEIEGKGRLGFDTGLSPQAFAQAKLAQFITQGGSIVLPNGAILPWQPGGVIERQGTMVVWGPGFTGERLDRLLDPAALKIPAVRSRALEALGCWIDAYPQGDLWPAGVLVVLGPEAAENTGGLVPEGAASPEAAGPIPVERAAAPAALSETGQYPRGTVYFPPQGLRLRAVQAEGEEAWFNGGESLVCRDLAGEAAASFTAAAMLYRILAAERAAAPDAGALPFPARDKDLLHQDMREGVFLPLRLAAPGLKPEAAEKVDRALAGIKEAMTVKRPPPAALGELLRGDPLFRELDPGEQAKLEEERLRCEKKRKLAVGTRRFVVRNAAALTGIAAALAIVILVANSIIAARRDRPTTAGMDSRQVVETYYGAFGQLDHTLMEACVMNKAGKGDIDMVTRYFVTTKVRQAYEYLSVAVIPAQEWFDMGAPPTVTPIFGVTDLTIIRTAGDEAGDEISYRVKYVLWIPGPGDEIGEDLTPITAVPGPAPGLSTESAQSPAPGTEPSPQIPGAGGLVEYIPPRGYAFTDEITLIRHKDAWRISKINRITDSPT
jgi:hypothetical protein